MDDIEQNLNGNVKQNILPCPFWLESIPLIILVICDILVCRYWIDKTDTVWAFPIFSYCYGGLCFGWWLLITIYRTVCFGIGGFYDLYWFCNIALVLTAVGAVFQLPTLIGQSMCLLFFPHATFWIDFLLYPCAKRPILNTFPFMFDDSTTSFEKFTSYHHFWFFPGLIVVLWKQPVLSIWSYILSIILFVLLNIMGHYMTPVTWYYPDGTERYLNVCLGHEYPEFAKSIPPFKWTINRPFIFHCLTITIVYILPVNLVTYFIIIGLQKLVLISFSFLCWIHELFHTANRMRSCLQKRL